MDDLTPEQEEAIEAWMISQEPPPMTAEEAHIEEVVATLELFIAGAKQALEGIDGMTALNLGGDMSALRALLEAALDKWQPETPEWGEP